MNSHAKLTAWRHKEDLLSLRSKFFPCNLPPQSLTVSDEDTTSISSAIALVHLYASRSRIPHTLQSTSHLFSVLLLISGSVDDEDSFRLAASMALIRFVNGLLDPGQQSQYAIPLQVLAKKIGLPSIFVEFRHTATHEGMPSLEMCERCLLGALEWLFHNYWRDLANKIDVVDEETEIAKMKELEQKEHDSLTDAWKQYRRIRRKNLNKLFKSGDTSEIGKEYWACVHSLQKRLSCEYEWWKMSYTVMIKRISSDKLSFEQLKKLYGPLLSYMITILEDEFVLSFCDTLLSMCYEYTNLKGMDISKGFNNDSEWKHGKQWCEWLLSNQFEDSTTLKIIELLGKRPDKYQLELLKQVQSSSGNRQELLTKVETKITSLKKIMSESKIKRFNDADDILGDLENLKKRKLQKSKPVLKVFQRAQDWEPKPFGVL